MNIPNLTDREKYYNKGIDDFIEAVINSMYAKSFVCCDWSECCSCITNKEYIDKNNRDNKDREWKLNEYNKWLNCKDDLKKTLIKIKENMYDK